MKVVAKTVFKGPAAVRVTVEGLLQFVEQRGDESRPTYWAGFRGSAWYFEQQVGRSAYELLAPYAGSGERIRLVLEDGEARVEPVSRI
jgi:hypothetical protein